MSRSALVTGAATRIGKEMALGLAAEGNNIVVHYMSSKTEAEQVVDEAKLFGVRAECVEADLLSDADVRHLISDAASLLGGPLSILINNASIFEYDNIHTVSMKSWSRHMDSNLKAPLFLMQEFSKQVSSELKDDRNENIPQGNIINGVDQRV